MRVTKRTERLPERIARKIILTGRAFFHASNRTPLYMEDENPEDPKRRFRTVEALLTERLCGEDIPIVVACPDLPGMREERAERLRDLHGYENVVFVEKHGLGNETSGKLANGKQVEVRITVEVSYPGKHVDDAFGGGKGW